MFERAMGSIVRGLPDAWGYRLVKNLASRVSPLSPTEAELKAAGIATSQWIGANARIPILS